MSPRTSAAYCMALFARLTTICIFAVLVATVCQAAGPNAVAGSGNALQASGIDKKFDVDEDIEVTELWTGKVYSSTFRFGVCFSSRGKIRGVLLLRQRNGQVDTYHFLGTSSRNMVQATHSSGHSFTGELIGRDRMEGSIQLKNGLSINLEGRRQQNVRLDMSDCAPLPEE